MGGCARDERGAPQARQGKVRRACYLLPAPAAPTPQVLAGVALRRWRWCPQVLPSGLLCLIPTHRNDKAPIGHCKGQKELFQLRRPARRRAGGHRPHASTSCSGACCCTHRKAHTTTQISPGPQKCVVLPWI